MGKSAELVIWEYVGGKKKVVDDNFTAKLSRNEILACRQKLLSCMKVCYFAYMIYIVVVEVQLWSSW